MKIVCANCKEKIKWCRRVRCWVHLHTLVAQCVFRTRPVATPEITVRRSLQKSPRK